MNRAIFREALLKYFNTDELQDLCFDEDIDHEMLRSNSKGELARELILHCQRNNQAAALLKKCARLRPDFPWFAEIAPELDKNTAQTAGDDLPPDIDEILEFAKEIARRGGGVAADYYYGKENEVYSSKEVKNLTTKADQEANSKIVTAVKEAYPDHHIIAEEGGSVKDYPSIEGYTWVIDAIDGTVNFFLGVPVFCTAIGILWQREPWAGVVYNPIEDELFFARKKGGAFRVRSGKRQLRYDPIYVNPEEDLTKAVVMTHLSSRRHARERFTASGLLDAIANAVRSIRAYGSGQLSLAYVAQGQFHAFINNSTHSWDQAAGLVIVQEAGGIVTDFRNEKWSIESESIIATANQSIHGKLAAIISAIYPFEDPVARQLRRMLFHSSAGQPSVAAQLVAPLNNLQKEPEQAQQVIKLLNLLAADKALAQKLEALLSSDSDS